MAAPGKSINYDLLLAGWRAGIKSPRQLADEYKALTGDSVSHAAIIKHFRKHGIERDLNPKIQAAADQIVARSMVSADETVQELATEKQIVETGAIAVAGVKKSHREQVSKSKGIVAKLLDELDKLEPVPLGDKDDPKTKYAAKLAAIKERAGIAKQLVEAQRQVISLEREAFGIVQYVDPDDKPEEGSTDEKDAARRLLFCISRLASQPPEGVSNG